MQLRRMGARASAVGREAEIPSLFVQQSNIRDRVIRTSKDHRGKCRAEQSREWMPTRLTSEGTYEDDDDDGEFFNSCQFSHVRPVLYLPDIYFITAITFNY